ncbi:MAG: TRAP transporter small permease [Rhodobacteraceae bacterium]|nr:TRAP transporter small permease [Paracoccaceae bacterium]
MTTQQNKGPASAGPMFDRCKTLLKHVDTASKGLVICAMAVMTVLVVTQVVFRYAFASAIDWSDEVARLAFVWAMFLAIPHGIRAGVHVGIDALVIRFSAALQERLFRLSAALGCILMLVLFYFSAQVTVYSWPELMPTINLTAAVYYIAVLIAAAHSTLHLLLLVWGGSETWSEETMS